MNGPLGRLGAAATLGQRCPQMTQRPGTFHMLARKTNPVKVLFFVVMDYITITYVLQNRMSLHNLSSPSSVPFPSTKAKYDSEEMLVGSALFSAFLYFFGSLDRAARNKKLKKRREGRKKFGQEVHPPWLLGWNPTINLPSSASDLNRSCFKHSPTELCPNKDRKGLRVCYDFWPCQFAKLCGD